MSGGGFGLLDRTSSFEGPTLPSLPQLDKRLKPVGHRHHESVGYTEYGQTTPSLGRSQTLPVAPGPVNGDAVVIEGKPVKPPAPVNVY